MVRIITYAMYVQNSIFFSFRKNEKIISLFFNIAYLCRYRVFLYLCFSVSKNKSPRDSRLIYKAKKFDYIA